MRFENLNENTLKEISQNEPEWVRNERINAFKLFNEIEDYSFKYGMTMKTDVSDINVSEFKSKSNLVIKNKDNRVIVKELKEAFIEDGLLLKNLFMKNIKSKLGLLNKSLVQEGLFIYVPKNTNVTETLILELEFLGNSFDYILIIVDKNSSINIFEKLISNTKIFRNNIVDIYVNEDSKVNFFSLQDLNEESHNFSTKRSFTSKNALCDFYNFDFGGLLNYNDVSTELNEGSYSNIYGIYFADKNQHFNLASSSIHNSNNTYSHLFTKGILDDKSNSIYRGLIKIKENAFNSNGYQKEDIIILSDDAKADSIPNLEIDNNEVKCSHGASIGHIDKDKLFYLMSRGLNRSKSYEFMILGFLSEIIDKIKEDSIKKEVIELIKSKIKNEY